MSRKTRSDQKDAQRRCAAVKLYRSGTPATEVARQLHRSRCWVYKWVHYRANHPWTRFRSAPRAPHHHPNQLSAKSERRIVHLRQLLMRHRQPRLRFTSVGARAMQKEWRRRYSEPVPSLSTIQRVLRRHHLTAQPPTSGRQAYRPHPLATYPDAVHATDIITRWITGGEVVQTFNTVDIYSNDVDSTSHATKTATAACEHLLHTWQQLGMPDVAQFDNESAFSGGNHPWVLGKVVRLCLSMGIEVVFIPLGEPMTTRPSKRSITCGRNASGVAITFRAVAMCRGFGAPCLPGIAMSISPRVNLIPPNTCGRVLACTRSRHAMRSVCRNAYRFVQAECMRCAASRQTAKSAFSSKPCVWANATASGMSG